MKNKYFFVLVMLICLLLVGYGGTRLYLETAGEEKETAEFVVVTSFYPMYIATENLLEGCQNVRLENLSEPQTGCLHDYQLTPADMKLLATADAFVVNGGGIESFLSQVAKAYPDLRIINASDGLNLIDDNAHAWMSPSLYQQQVANIASGLENANTSNQSMIQTNQAGYNGKLDQIISEVQQIREQVKGQDVIIFHEAYAYLAQDLGMNVLSCMDLDEERQVSAGEVADVISQIREKDVQLILAEELYGKSMGDTISRQTNVKMLYLNTLVRGDYQKDGYISGMEENLKMLKEALDL